MGSGNFHKSNQILSVMIRTKMKLRRAETFFLFIYFILFFIFFIFFFIYFIFYFFFFFLILMRKNKTSNCCGLKKLFLAVLLTA